MSGSLALITGASSGIGLEFARIFAERGHDLVLSARREDRLRELARELGGQVNVTTIPADLSRARGPSKLLSQVGSRAGQIEFLVNNAGIAQTGRFESIPAARLMDMVHLNVRAVAELCHAILPRMTSRGSGRILNVSSVVGFQAVPGMSVYAASKAFVLSLTESLSEELQGTGVTATALCPGLTKTDLVEGLGQVDVPDYMMSRPRDVAHAGYHAMMRGDVVCIPGLANQAMVGWLQYQPRPVVRFLSGVLGRSVFR